MEIDPKLKLRIVHGDPALVEREVNDLAANGFVPLQYFVGGSEKPWVVVLCLAESEVRKAQMMAPGMPGPLGRRGN